MYWTDRDGDFEIFTMRPDRTQKRRVTENTISDLYPFYEPNGSRVYLNRFLGSDTEIVSIRLDGTQARNITDNDLHDVLVERLSRSSISASSSSPSFHASTASAFSRTCSALVAPAITVAISGWHGQPRHRELQDRVAVLLGECAQALDDVEPLVGQELVPAVAAGHPRPGRRRLTSAVLAREHPRCEREVRHEARARAGGSAGSTSSRGSRSRRLYSFCTVTKGRTSSSRAASAASSSCFAEKFEQPISRTLPSSTMP